MEKRKDPLNISSILQTQDFVVCLYNLSESSSFTWV